MTETTDNQDVKSQETIAPESEAQKPKESEVGSKEYNWRQMEQKNKQLEQELIALRNDINKKAEEQTPDKPDELSTLEEDDLITKNQAIKLAEEKAKKIIEQELNSREKAKQPSQVKAEYSDYDQVVTKENIELLVKEDPELEYDIQVSKNPYKRIYKEIKKADFYLKSFESKENENKILENSKKPVSSNTLGKQSPLSQANEYAKGHPNLFAEMQKFRGGTI